MLPRLKIPGWLSSVKTVALKRENTQCRMMPSGMLDIDVFSRMWIVINQW